MSKTISDAAPKRSVSPGDGVYSDAQLLLAARLYYVDGILQNQIAKMVGVSQAKVSRMLAVARDRGLVRITVPEYEPRDREREQRLIDRFHLKSAVVIRRVQGQTVADLRNTLGYFAGPVVAASIAPYSTLAVAGGRTLQSLTDAMSRTAGPVRPVVVQAMGSVDSTPGPYDASEIARNLAQPWGGVYLTLNTPAFAPTAAVGRQLLELKDTREVFARLAAAEMALVGVGNLQNSVFIERGILSPRDLQDLRRAGAVGEILGRFYDEHGQECQTPYRHRVMSLPLEDLRAIPNVVVVIAGSDRSAAICGGIRGGIIKSLVIDDEGAAALLSDG
jgi:deoxyribonucleoside regulator